MKWIESSVTPVCDINASDLIRKVEIAARTCYRSEDLIGEGTAYKLIRNCISRGHESVIEHASITFSIVCDRGVSHELVRHRLASYSQESTRYCSYNKDKFGKGLTFIQPWWMQEEGYEKAADAIDTATSAAEHEYLRMIQDGFPPDVARCVLPNCLATTVVVTMNMRELRHFLKLRLSKKAHPDIRKIAKCIVQMLKDNELEIFIEDIIKEYEI